MKNKFKVPKTIKARNAWFNSLTPEDKRVAIAQDVIEQLNLQKFVATSGEYFIAEDIPNTNSLQKAIDNKEVQCSVCAMGAVFASRVRLGNECNIGAVNSTYAELGNVQVNSDNVLNYTTDIFTEEQMRIMEFCFEGRDVDMMFKPNWVYLSDFDSEEEYEAEVDRITELNRKCEAFYEAYYSEEDRMRAIMNNIISNKGQFII